MNSYSEERMAEDYGPLAPHSEYRRGDHIVYRNGGAAARCTGTIIWISGPGEVVWGKQQQQQHPTRYRVERDGAGDSFPDVVYQTDIIGLDGPQEPIIEA